mmetsp:Transcript_45814/g.127159  ORF Transcript_45814/g.127159 Transcript_45814/m.127159 type:complete len:145 (+) Transcript_45814:368-802(+)
MRRSRTSSRRLAKRRTRDVRWRCRSAKEVSGAHRGYGYIRVPFAIVLLPTFHCPPPSSPLPLPPLHLPVLNVVTEEHGSWVLNKQAPNQQIWWSSPLSGPMRFEFVASRGAWVGTRADVELIGLLHDEFSETMGVDIRSKLEDT